jgi:hypothetical protein
MRLAELVAADVSREHLRALTRSALLHRARMSRRKPIRAEKRQLPARSRLQNAGWRIEPLDCLDP